MALAMIQMYVLSLLLNHLSLNTYFLLQILVVKTWFYLTFKNYILISFTLVKTRGKVFGFSFGGKNARSYDLIIRVHKTNLPNLHEVCLISLSIIIR